MQKKHTWRGWHHLGKRHIWRPLQHAAVNWYSAGTFEMGAALAYYGVFAIAPMIVLTIAIAGLLFGEDVAEGRVLRQVQSTAGHPIADAIAHSLVLAYRHHSTVWATVAGAVVLFFAVTGLFSQLQSSLNRIWEVRPKPGRGVWGVVKDRFWSFVAVLGVGALMLAAVLANAALAGVVSEWEGLNLPGSASLWRAVNIVLGWVFLTLAFTLIYQVLPDVEIAWSDVWVGAAATALFVMLGNWLISVYLSWSGTTTGYGAIGSLVVLLLWVYYCTQVLLFGAEFTQAYARQTGKPIRPSANAEPMRPYTRDRTFGNGG